MKAFVRDALKDLLQNVVYPDRFVWRLPASSGAVALTFDDGPHPEWTPRVLETLARHSARATFFLVGEAVRMHPELVRRMVAEGHSVGGHSFDHTVITGRPAADLRDDLSRCRAAIQEACGVDTILFRPPKGEVSANSIHRVCRAGYRLVHWSRTYSDYRKDGTAALLGRIEAAGAVPGDILLFHDNNPFTAEALDPALTGWRGRGLRFDALAQS